jgi:hypothetical protein
MEEVLTSTEVALDTKEESFEAFSFRLRGGFISFPASSKTTLRLNIINE